jgi:hypothetical protein
MDHGRRQRLLHGVVVVFACLTIFCTGAPPPRQISNSRQGAYEAALAATTNGAVAAWHDTRDGNGEIYLRLLDAEGSAAGPELRLTNDEEQSYEPSIAAIGDAVAVTWYDKAADGTLTARLGVWNPDGSPQWTTTLARDGRNPVVRTDKRTITVAWIQQPADGVEAVWLGTWDERGDALAPPRPLGPAHRTTWNLNAAVDADGVAWVVFDAVASTKASELFLARADSRNVTLTRLTSDDGRESKYPDVAIRDGRVALTWYDVRDGNTEVYLFAGAVSGLSAGIDAQAQRVTATAGESIGAYVTWNGDRIGLAWSDDTEGQHEVYFQAFDPMGRPLAEPTRVTSNSTSSLIPAIEPWRDGFALAWNEYVPATEGHVGKSEIAFGIVR